MAKIHATKTGDWFVDRKMKRLAGTDQKKAIRKASRPALKPLQQEAKSTAKSAKQSGKYHKGIKVRSLKRSRSRVGARVTIDRKSFDGDFYATFQELGWKAGKRKKKQKGIRAMKSAAKRKRRHVLRIYKRELKQVIKELSR